MSQPQERITRASRRLRKVATAAMVAAPVVNVLFWALAPHWPELAKGLPVAVGPDLPLSGQVAGFVISCLPMGAAMAGLRFLRRLFGLYAQGKVFELENVICFRKMGWYLFALAGANFLAVPLLSMALSFHWPKGTRVIAVGLESSDLLLAILAATVLTIAWVMAEAAQMKQENDQFV